MKGDDITVDPHSHQDAAYHGDGGWHPGDDDTSYHPKGTSTNGTSTNGTSAKKDTKAKE